MCAIYAFMRYCDDLSDEPGDAKAAAIDAWKHDLEEALKGSYSKYPGWPAFHDAVQRYGIPHEYFYDMIDGVRSDLEPRDIQTFEELYRYCYEVASVVGLVIIHIFGFESQEAPKLAEKCGIAFQLTNILRDVKEDQERGRIYLPREDRQRFSDFRELMRFEAERARRYYEESRPLIGLVHPRSRPSLWALVEIYRRLLERIAASDFDVFAKRIRVPTLEKAAIVARAWAKGKFTSGVL
jgi:phytoene synthase